jgi:predicted neutral ceramidase superfamily lipid hydrolase
VRVSGEEVLRVEQLRAAAATPIFGIASNRLDAADSKDTKMVLEAISRAVDVREDVVASLRERIEAGTYQVSGEQIAEMMIRRTLADRVR